LEVRAVLRWITGVAVGAALLVLVVGCGGGGGDSTSEVTKAEFTKQADSVCAEGKSERKAAYEKYAKEVQAKSSGQPSPQAERELADKMVDETVIPSLQQQLGELEKLGMPADDEEKISQMLKSLSQGLVELEDGGVRQLVKGGKLVIFQEEAEGFGLTCTVF
jgi:hypothetical protein